MYQYRKKPKCSRRKSDEGRQKPLGQDNRSATPILLHLSTSGNPPTRQLEVALPAGWRAGQIIKKAFAELIEVARAEQARFPRITRLAQAIKRGSGKVSLELVSLGLAYPVATATLAVLVFGWLYFFGKAGAQQ